MNVGKRNERDYAGLTLESALSEDHGLVVDLVRVFGVGFFGVFGVEFLNVFEQYGVVVDLVGCVWG